MLLIYDHDDENISQLKSRWPLVETNTSVKTFILNARSDDLYIDYTDKSLTITQGKTIITNEDFERSEFILFYRWRMEDVPFVVSSLEESSEKNFSEREWSSIIIGMLLYYENIFPNKVWINKPSLFYSLRNKQFLMSIAKINGLLQPKFYISNKVRVLNDLDNITHYMAKPISSDEQIDNERYFRPCKIEKKYIKENTGHITDCPSYIQEYICADYEVRSYYLLGQILSVKLTAKNKYTDIRDVIKENLIIELFNLPANLSKKIICFCQKLGINYCCFDFLSKKKSYYLIDITPNASWSFYDYNFLITDWMVKTISEYNKK